MRLTGKVYKCDTCQREESHREYMENVSDWFTVGAMKPASLDVGLRWYKDFCSIKCLSAWASVYPGGARAATKDGPEAWTANLVIAMSLAVIAQCDNSMTDSERPSNEELCEIGPVQNTFSHGGIQVTITVSVEE